MSSPASRKREEHDAGLSAILTDGLERISSKAIRHQPAMLVREYDRLSRTKLAEETRSREPV